MINSPFRPKNEKKVARRFRGRAENRYGRTNLLCVNTFGDNVFRVAARTWRPKIPENLVRATFLDAFWLLIHKPASQSFGEQARECEREGRETRNSIEINGKLTFDEIDFISARSFKFQIRGGRERSPNQIERGTWMQSTPPSGSRGASLGTLKKRFERVLYEILIWSLKLLLLFQSPNRGVW